MPMNNDFRNDLKDTIKDHTNIQYTTLHSIDFKYDHYRLDCSICGGQVNFIYNYCDDAKLGRVVAIFTLQHDHEVKDYSLGDPVEDLTDSQKESYFGTHIDKYYGKNL